MSSSSNTSYSVKLNTRWSGLIGEAKDVRLTSDPSQPRQWVFFQPCQGPCFSLAKSLPFPFLARCFFIKTDPELGSFQSNSLVYQILCHLVSSWVFIPFLFSWMAVFHASSPSPFPQTWSSHPSFLYS